MDWAASFRCPTSQSLGRKTPDFIAISELESGRVKPLNREEFDRLAGFRIQ